MRAQFDLDSRVAVYVFDNAPLSYLARARQLPMLGRLTAGNERVTTRAVIDEIKNAIGGAHLRAGGTARG